MKVLKFGGSSVANAANISRVIDIVLGQHQQDHDIIVVVSAAGGITDSLIQMAEAARSGNDSYQALFEALCRKHQEMIEELLGTNARQPVQTQAQKLCDELDNLLQGVALLKELSTQALDAIMSTGEQLSAQIISAAFNYRGVPCTYVDARELIQTDNKFGHAAVQIEATYQRIAHAFKQQQGLSVMGGFIAADQSGVTTTLGRGGSDYTASLLGAALDAPIIEIWTDVDGVMTADPRHVKGAFPLTSISYEEAGELAHFGAKVIHPKTMKPARLKNIPILIKNTFNPEAPGTLIDGVSKQRQHLVTGVSSLANIALLRLQSSSIKYISEISARVFQALSKEHIEVLLTT
ncbi:aspartate kinase [Candidatus Uhrbacteria bacterium]|nr:aspartate kinase [Candidatus Uhrbacteria bacterium]